MVGSSLAAMSGSAVGRASDSRARGLEFNTRYGHIPVSLPLTEEGQLSVAGKSMCF